ncbi:MAG TPA: glycosyltransferase family 39 protein [Vicinamibacterales bacterium]|nr:glycosyltransferase family 39 protein [Vicinamibacterales bacterium]
MDVRGAGSMPRIVVASAAASLVLGLTFIFVRSPHPWGWEGFDHYHDLGLALARGAPFPTTDVPWGYAYVLSLVYRVVGDRPWVPLSLQAIVNAAVPVLVYDLVARELGRRVAIVAAVLTGLFSFNTVYASTQSSDALCTVTFLASIALFARGLDRPRTGTYLASGLLCGIATQFRPNLLLFPTALALVAMLRLRPRARPVDAVVYVLAAISVTVPWAIHAYRLTGELLPTSTHGGIQLWYGSLQTGTHLTSRAHNPRSIFETPSFDYTSLGDRSIVVEALCDSVKPARVDLVFWSDRAPAPVHVRGAPTPHTIEFTLPGQPLRSVLYYYFASADGAGTETFTPARGPRDPYVFFVDDRHLDDLDARGNLLDGFDFVKAARAAAWQEAAPPAADLDHDGHFTEADVRLAAAALATTGEHRGIYGPPVVEAMTATDEAIAIRFIDGSALDIPRAWHERITDITPIGKVGSLAAQVLTGRRRVASLPEPSAADGPVACLRSENIRVNEVFYRREPHLMHRYTALAFDNISRDPVGFVGASLFRALRLFVVAGTEDVDTAQQFAGSGWIYRFATLASVAYLALATIGVAIAAVRYRRVGVLLTPILYVPATICFVLTNMRYTVTVQPFLFAFAAVPLTAVLERWSRERPIRGHSEVAATGTRTGRRP